MDDDTQPDSPDRSSSTNAPGASAALATKIEQIQASLCDRDHAAHAIVTQAPLVVWAVDSSGRFVLSEGQGLARLGLKAAEAVGRSFEEMFADEPSVLSHVRAALAGQESVEQVFIGEFAFRSWIAPIRDAAGTVVGAQGIATDITDQVRAEELLRRNERRWRAIVQSATEFIFTLDRERRVTFINRVNPTRKMADVIGTDLVEFVVPEQASLVRDAIAKVFAEGKPVSLDAAWQRPDGELAWFETHFGLLLEDGAEPQVIGVASDITARKRAERELQRIQADLELRIDERTVDLDRMNLALRTEIARRSVVEAEQRTQKQLLELVLNSMPSGVVVADEQGTPILMNPAAGALLGLDPVAYVKRGALVVADLVSVDGHTPLPPEDRPLPRAVRGETVRGMELLVRRNDRPDPLFVIANAMALQDDDGTKRGGVVIFHDETNRHRAEQTARQTLERFDLMVRGSKEGLWDCAVTADSPFAPDNPIYYSQRFREVLGYTEDEFPGVLRSWSSCIHPEDRDRVFTTLSAHLFEYQPFDAEYRMLDKQGRVLWVEARGQALWDAAGRPVRMSGSMMDITARKEAEASLRHSETRFRRLVESANVIPWEMDFAAERMTYVGPQIVKLLGFPIDEWYAPGFWKNRLRPQDRDRVLDFFRQALSRADRDGSDLEYRIVAADGAIVWVRDVVSSVPRSTDAALLTGFMFDVTDRKKAELDRRAGEAQLQTILDSSPSVVHLKDTQGRYLFVNRAHEETFGRKREELAGRTVFDLFPADIARQLQHNDRQVIETDAPLQSVEAVLTRNGIRSYLTVKFPLHDHDGRVRAVCGISTDITERKQSEERLRQDQQFLRNMLKAHERDRKLMAYEIHDGVVQDITAGLWHLEALVSSLAGLDPDVKLKFDVVLNLLRRSIGEARRVLSGLRPPILDEAGIVMALQYLVAEQAVPGELEIHFAHDVHFARLDPLLEGTIFRIVQESLTNIKRHSGAHVAEVRFTQQGDRLQLLIRDFGRGFVMSNVPADRFGLEGIRKRAALFGGHSQFESTPGRGTRITVDLPATPSDPQDLDQQPDASRQLPSA